MPFHDAIGDRVFGEQDAHARDDVENVSAGRQVNDQTSAIFTKADKLHCVISCLWTIIGGHADGNFLNCGFKTGYHSRR
jgi:hypothetical protein